MFGSSSVDMVRSRWENSSELMLLPSCSLSWWLVDSTGGWISCGSGVATGGSVAWVGGGVVNEAPIRWNKLLENPEINELVDTVLDGTVCDSLSGGSAGGSERLRGVRMVTMGLLPRNCIWARNLLRCNIN